MDTAKILVVDDEQENPNGVLSFLQRVRIRSSHREKRNRKYDGIMVTVNSVDGAFAMCVGKVVGVQRVVFREINGLDCRSETVSGGALRGDGSVALILDVNKL